MKTQNMKLNMFIFFLSICQANTLANTLQEIIHEEAEFAKVCISEDQSVLVLSTVSGVQRSFKFLWKSFYE